MSDMRIVDRGGQSCGTSGSGILTRAMICDLASASPKRSNP